MKTPVPERKAAHHDEDEWAETTADFKVVSTSDREAAANPERGRRITEEFERAGYVMHQQNLALRALRDGELGAARAALRALRSTDFERRDRAEIHLGVLRDSRSEEDDLRDAIARLIMLTPRP